MDFVTIAFATYRVLFLRRPLITGDIMIPIELVLDLKGSFGVIFPSAFLFSVLTGFASTFLLSVSFLSSLDLLSEILFLLLFSLVLFEVLDFSGFSSFSEFSVLTKGRDINRSLEPESPVFQEPIFREIFASFASEFCTGGSSFGTVNSFTKVGVTAVACVTDPVRAVTVVSVVVFGFKIDEFEPLEVVVVIEGVPELDVGPTGVTRIWFDLFKMEN